MAAEGLSVISPGGDLILEVSQEEGGQSFAYRVDSKALQESSRYFENLLSDRFSEGQQLSAALEALKIAGHSNVADAPASTLPRIKIVNIGRIGISKGSNIQNLTADFLRTLHGQDLAVSNPPVPNLANLAVVADRFDATEWLARYVNKKRFLHQIDAKSKNKASASPTEERVRQKLLVGLLFDQPQWVMRYSQHLIVRDSVQWRPGVVEDDESKALWWDLPNGVEDELIRRREYILETINSLQSHFLKLYTSGERQCKLGYDSSIPCDSFQLGEMVRFFTKLDTLRLQGTIYDNREPIYYMGDIERLLEMLRQCPSYQVDRNHSHCGLRTRLMPLLDMIQPHLSLVVGSTYIGICAECWGHHRSSYAWSAAKRPVLWTRPKTLVYPRATNILVPSRNSTPAGYTNGYQKDTCLNGHIPVREMYMAAERDWTTRDT